MISDLWFVGEAMAAKLQRFMRESSLGMLETPAGVSAVVQPQPETKAQLAIVPVRGLLMKSPDFFEQLFLGATDADHLADVILEAGSKAESLLLDIHSPGGDEYSIDPIRAALQLLNQKGVKTVAFNSGARLSAGLFSTLDAAEHYASPGATEGSIGAYLIKEDRSDRDAKEGVKYEMFSSGPYKGMTHPTQSLNDDQRKHLQARADAAGKMFADAVAERFGLKDHEKWATGATFRASEALALGLIQGVRHRTDLVSSLLTPKKGQKGRTMAGLEMAAVRTALNLGEDADLRTFHAALETRSKQAVDAERVAMAGILGVDPDKMSNQYLADLAAAAKDGEKYRASLLEQGKSLLVTVYGQEEGAERLPNWERVYKGAAMADLEAAIRNLEKDRARIFPAGASARDPKDATPKAKRSAASA